MPAVRDAEHRVLHRDPHGYCAHPHLVSCGGELLVVFNWSPRRAFVLHPPQEPLVHNLLMRSADEGASWSAPIVVPDYGWSGAECAGLTDLGGGRLLLNQWRFRWHSLPAARHHPNRMALAFPRDLAVGLLDSSELDSGSAVAADPERLVPWARGPGTAYVHLSPGGGRTWPESALPDVHPFAGGYGMRGGVALADGTVLLPLCDAPRYAAVFVLRSGDGGHAWSDPATAAAVDGRLFEEPAPLLLPSGEVLLLLRENRSRSLWSTRSGDGGVSWSPPAPTGIGGYPAHLCTLPDGRALCTYAVRHGPRAILAALSGDDGRSWGASAPLVIRGDLPDKDLGYPCTLALPDGRLLSVYYARDETGTTCVQATGWTLPG